METKKKERVTESKINENWFSKIKPPEGDNKKVWKRQGKVKYWEQW